MRRLFKYKSTVAAIVFFVFVIFHLLSPSIPISMRAVVVGMAIDKDGDDYVLSAQIIQSVPSTDGSGGNSSYAIVQGRGRSMGEAVNDVSTSSGYFTSLAHCSAVLLGEEMTRKDCFSELCYLIKNTKLPEDALLIATSGDAYGILKEEVGLSTVSAIALKIIEQSDDDTPHGVACRIQQYLKAAKSPSKTVVLPLCEVKESVEEPSTMQQSGDGKKKVVLKITRSLCSEIGKSPILFDENETFFYNLVAKNFRLGNESAVTEDGRVLNLAVIKKSSRTEVVSAFEMNVNVNISYRLIADELNFEADKIFPKSEVEKTEREYEKGIGDLFERCKNEGVDLFCAKDEYFRKNATEEGFDLNGLVAAVKVKVDLH